MSASWNVYPFVPYAHTLSAENVLEALKVARCWHQSQTFFQNPKRNLEK